MSDPPPTPLSYAAPPLPAAVVPVDASMAAVASPPASVSVEELPRVLAAARAGWRPIGRAVRYATFDAWTLAAFAALSLPCMAGGVAGILLAVALGAAAAVEFVGVRRLRRMDVTAPRLLAVNQLWLGGALVLYALWNLYLTHAGRGMMAELSAHSSELGDIGPEAAGMVRSVLVTLYACLAVLGVVLPGATAWFYSSRTRLLGRFLAETPAWVVQMQRERPSL